MVCVSSSTCHHGGCLTLSMSGGTNADGAHPQQSRMSRGGRRVFLGRRSLQRRILPGNKYCTVNPGALVAKSKAQASETAWETRRCFQDHPRSRFVLGLKETLCHALASIPRDSPVLQPQLPILSWPCSVTDCQGVPWCQSFRSWYQS